VGRLAIRVVCNNYYGVKIYSPFDYAGSSVISLEKSTYCLSETAHRVNFFVQPLNEGKKKIRVHMKERVLAVVRESDARWQYKCSLLLNSNDNSLFNFNLSLTCDFRG
jgi:hypothetical protein